MVAEPATPAAPETGRRGELDVLRVLVVVGLVFFHSAMVFNPFDDFYVKNADTTALTMVIAGFGVLWAMPLLFLVAGISAWYSLRSRGVAAFTGERIRRLGVPLVFATVVLIPVPQWLRSRAENQESYLEFLPRFFQIHLEWTNFPFVLQGEYFETGHLWFVLLLLTFAFMLAAAVRWVPAEFARRALGRLVGVTRRRTAVLLLAVPLAVCTAALGLEEEYAGWTRWAYLVFFVYGFVLVSDDRLRAVLRRDRNLAGICGFVLLMVGFPMFMVAGGDPFTDYTAWAITARALFGATGWCLVAAILGTMLRERRQKAGDPGGSGRTRNYLGYLAEGSLPLYVLHQPIVVVVAFFVVAWDASIAVKYGAIVALSLVLTVVAYDLLVRRTPPTRFLFGLKPTARR